MAVPCSIETKEPLVRLGKSPLRLYKQNSWPVSCRSFQKCSIRLDRGSV